MYSTSLDHVSCNALSSRHLASVYVAILSPENDTSTSGVLILQVLTEKCIIHRVPVFFQYCDGTVCQFLQNFPTKTGLLKEIWCYIWYIPIVSLNCNTFAVHSSFLGCVNCKIQKCVVISFCNFLKIFLKLELSYLCWIYAENTGWSEYLSV